ncbi:MAG: sugar transferase [Chloroflexi bacterium]|nr:sugar transferase [Chloroflexota bacterium]
MATPLRCSVVLIVTDAADRAIDCLDGLAGQTLAPDSFEVLVIDSAGSAVSGQQVEAWLAAHPGLPWQLHRLPGENLSAARNYAARIAQTSLLLFTTADCVAQPDWAASLLGHFEQPDVIGVKGTLTTRQAGLLPQFVQVEFEDRYERLAKAGHLDFIDIDSAGYRRDVFLANGGFDERLEVNGDHELSFRLAAKGYRLLFAPEAQVVHRHENTLAAYARRKFAIAFWKPLLTHWHPERLVFDSYTPQSLKMQMLLWAAILLLLPVAGGSLFWHELRPAWTLLGLAALLYGLSIAPFVRRSAGHSWQLAVAAPGLLAVRAVALSLGYAAGTVHFVGTPPGATRPVIPGWMRLIKRGMDIVGALAGLLAGVPLVLLAAIAIKLDSRGPIFYLQRRVGEHGRSFRIVKLRSMQVNAEERLAELIDLTALDEPAFKLVDDPRVTRVGRLLRRYSLDEWPQFWNVLLGEMSLVGPRPEEERIVALYNDYQRQRLLMKPGITGPMQVSGRGDLSLRDRIALELDYIQHYTLWRDIEILFKTVPTVLSSRGAR